MLKNIPQRVRSTRTLRLQHLEKRNLLTAKISELLIQPAYDFHPDTTQFIELRGEPNSSINEGTYFVVVGESRLQNGSVRQYIDLSGLSFGSNGYLVISQGSSPHAVDPESVSVQSTNEGFVDVPGNIFHAAIPEHENLLRPGSYGYFLIETDAAISFPLDIDANNDGNIDPVFTESWNILDSISMHRSAPGAHFGYSDIVFSESSNSNNDFYGDDDVTVIYTDGYGYVARYADSDGTSADDWIYGTVFTDLSHVDLFQITPEELQTEIENADRWRLGENTPPSGLLSQFVGRDLDHVGGPNFVGGVKGTVENAAASPGTKDTLVFADTNSNGSLDTLVIEVDPDDTVDLNNLVNPNGTARVFELTTAYPGVNITSNGRTPTGNSMITAAVEDFPTSTLLSNRVFASGTSDWFSSNFPLRFDFFDPVHSASLVVIGTTDGLEPIGHLEAYNADGHLLDSQIVQLASGRARESLAVASDEGEIAYLLAYGNSVVSFDQLVYTQTEPHATTDERGNFHINHLFPGEYDLITTAGTIYGNQHSVTVEQYEQFDFRSARSLNNPPTVFPSTFTISEDASSGTSVGTVMASDPDSDPLVFGFVNNQNDGFAIDQYTGEILTANQTQLDHETSPLVQLDVFVQDVFGEIASSTVSINVLDANESPSLDDTQFSVAELVNVGTVIGNLNATDQDVGQSLHYDAIAGSIGGAITISSSGEVTVVSQLDFESTSQYVFDVQVSDDGDPPLHDVASITINVFDQNEPPDIQPFSRSIPEDAESGRIIARVHATDPDQNQSIVYEIVSGDDEGRFSINRQSGLVQVRNNASFDFETEPVISLLVSATDTAVRPLADHATVTINVTDVNESPEISGFSASISELADPGLEVGRVTASDPDQNQSLEFEILGDERFDVDPLSGIVTISPNAIFDYETEPSITLIVSATDTGDPPEVNTATVQIRVIDENEPPTIPGLETSMPENSQAGFQVGQVQGFDQDQDQSIRYQIEGDDGRFRIDPVSGIVSVSDNALFDFETEPEIKFTVLAMDSGIPPLISTTSISIVVTDTNEPPTFTQTIEPLDALTGMELVFELPNNLVQDPEGTSGWVFSTSYDDADLPSWLMFDADARVFYGIPTSTAIGITEVQLHAHDASDSELFSSLPVVINVSPSEMPLHNAVLRHDVNGDRAVTAFDALRIINFLSTQDPDTLYDQSVRIDAFLDVNGDNFVTAFDALQVINELQNRQVVDGQSENIVTDFLDKPESSVEAIDGILAELA